MLRKAIIIFFILLLGFSALAKPSLKAGSPPPFFSLKNLAGQTVSLDNFLGNKVIVLSFFASWSKSCQQEIAFLQRLAKQYRDKKLKIIGISYDRKTRALKNYLSKSQPNFTVLHDKKLKTLKDFRILIIPTLFVIDQQGNIKSVYLDFDKNVEKAVSQAVQRLLNPPKKR